MNTKNYFLVSGALNVLFGISLAFLPGMMTDEYLKDPAMRTAVTDLLSRLYAVVLLALGAGYFAAYNAGPSPARKGFIITGLIADWATTIIHVLALNQGLEKPFAWGTVVLLGLMGVWGLVVLRSNK